MDDLTATLTQHAQASGADPVGIADIARFDGLPAQHDPHYIFPEAKSGIILGRRITRGTLSGVEEGAQFSNLGILRSRRKLDLSFLPCLI